MSKSLHIGLLSLILCLGVLTSCGVKRKAATPTFADEPAAPAWQTCLIQGAKITLITPEDKFTSSATMQVERDSVLVISVTPMLGIEMFRIEATPALITAIDKMHAQYAQATYDEINGKLVPKLTWETLQQICSAELPTGDRRARMLYSYGDDNIEIIIDYPERQIDVPIRTNPARLDRYTRINIKKWL